jgi:predicted DNA-binding transcriptional regulator YafY
MRADRLLSILMLLQTRGQMTAQELADRLEVSTRTIYRDLDALSTAGVPVYAERGPAGGCRLLESYRTNLTGLKEAEVRALFMFTVPRLLADVGAAKESESALLKLTAALPAPFRQDAELVQQRIHLDPLGWFQGEETSPWLPLLQEAIWQEQRLRLEYRRSDGQWVRRLVEPYGLVAKAGIWYLVAGNFGRPYTFRVSRIHQAAMSGSHFQRPPQFDLVSYWQEWCAAFEKSRQQVEVTLAVQPAGLPLLVQAFGEGMHNLLAQSEGTDEQGRIRLTLTLDSEENACVRLLGLGPAVEVVAPASLRKRLAITAQYQLGLYAREMISP